MILSVLVRMALHINLLRLLLHCVQLQTLPFGVQLMAMKHLLLTMLRSHPTRLHPSSLSLAKTFLTWKDLQLRRLFVVATSCTRKSMKTWPLSAPVVKSALLMKLHPSSRLRVSTHGSSAYRAGSRSTSKMKLTDWVFWGAGHRFFRLRLFPWVFRRVMTMDFLTNFSRRLDGKSTVMRYFPDCHSVRTFYLIVTVAIWSCCMGCVWSLPEGVREIRYHWLE